MSNQENLSSNNAPEKKVASYQEKVDVRTRKSGSVALQNFNQSTENIYSTLDISASTIGEPDETSLR